MGVSPPGPVKSIDFRGVSKIQKFALNKIWFTIEIEDGGEEPWNPSIIDSNLKFTKFYLL